MKWGIHFDIPRLKDQIREMEEQSANPDFWNDLDNSQKVLQKTKALKEKVARFEGLQTEWEDLSTLVELALEEEDATVLEEISNGYEQLQKDFNELKLETLLTGTYDKNNAIVPILSVMNL